VKRVVLNRPTQYSFCPGLAGGQVNQFGLFVSLSKPVVAMRFGRAEQMALALRSLRRRVVLARSEQLTGIAAFWQVAAETRAALGVFWPIGPIREAIDPSAAAA